MQHTFSRAVRKALAGVALFGLLLGTASSFGALVPLVQAAAPPNWDASGTYVANFNYLGTDYSHDVSLTQDGAGALTGSGGSPAGANTYTWVVDSGSVSGDTIDFTVHYTATPDAVTPLTVMNVVGTIAPDGTMSGTWSDNYQGGERTGTWSSTSGSATALPAPAAEVTTDPATGVTHNDATLNGTNGPSDATGHSFWVSTSTFSTASPTIPAGVYSTPDLGAIGAGTPFSALLSSVTTSGVSSNLPPITPNTTYYYAAWSNVGGTWYPGSILSFTTEASGSVFIDANTNGTLDSGEQTFTTIQAAVNAASSGQTVIAGEGTYNEQVKITKPLILLGAQAGVDARTRATTNESTIENSCGPVQIMADHVTIDGFTIQGSTQGDPCFMSGIWYNPGYSGTHGGFQILNNIVQDNISGIGVGNDGTLPALVQYNLIKNNNNAGPGSGNGLSAAFAFSNVEINNNTFDNNQLYLNGFESSGITGVQSVTVSHNEIKNVEASGLFLMGASGVTISGNNIHGNAGGISVAGGGSSVAILGNTLQGNANRGVSISDDYAVGTNSGVSVNNNDIGGNGLEGLLVGEAAHSGTVDATCNWWGAASGPGPVGPGSGDEVSAGATFQPWRTTSSLDGDNCNGPLPDVHVGVYKYIDGVPATANSAASASFPMVSTTTASNINGGAETGGNAYSLGAGNGYHASTTAMAFGASYATQEILTGSVVGPDCSASHPFSLVGYSYGNTLAEAAAAATSTTAPSFSELSQDKYVIVWNQDCSQTGGGLGGDVVSPGVLHVDSIEAVQTSATADDTFANGWKYIFHITAPSNEPNLSMKFADWLSGSNTIPVANNMRISSAQASNGPVTLTAANTYSSPLTMVWDLATSTPAGRQVDVLVEVKIPVGTVNGSYTTSYGVQTQP